MKGHYNATRLLADLASLASTVRTALGLGTASLLASDTDTSLAADSDSRVATQKAVKAYIAAAVTGLLDLKGSQDCAANPDYPAASKGDAYVVTVAGKIGGASGTAVDVGDVYLALADNAGGTQAAVGTSWSVLEHNLAGVLLDSMLDADVALAANSDAKIATQKAVKAYVDANAGGASVYMPADIATVLASGTAGDWERAPGAPSVIRLAAQTALNFSVADAVANPPGGASWVNSTNITSAAIVGTASAGDGNLDMVLKVGTATEFSGATHTAPQLGIDYGQDYRTLTVEVRGQADAKFRLGGLALNEPTPASHNVRIAIGYAASLGGYVVLSNMDGGTNTSTVITSGQVTAGVLLRLDVGSYATHAYYSLDHGTTWIRLVSHLACYWPKGFVGGRYGQSGEDTTTAYTFRFLNYDDQSGDANRRRQFGMAGRTAAPTALTLLSPTAATAWTPDVTDARLRCAAMINGLPGDAGSWVFSLTGSASAPAEATTYQAAASLVLKEPSSDTAASGPHETWILRAKCTSASGAQAASIDLSQLFLQAA